MKKLYALPLFFLLLLTYTICLAQAPQITSFAPASGPVGSTITLSGNNFNASASANTVYVGGVRATVTAGGSSSLTVTVPAGGVYVPITVVNTGSGLQGSSAKPFMFTFNTGLVNDFTNSSFGLNSFSDIHGQFRTFLQLVDIDGDGKLDLGIGHISSQDIDIYKNTSTKGTLKPASLTLSATYGITPSYLLCTPSDLKFADIDGDGKPEMIVPYLDQNKLTIYQNNAVPGTINAQTFGTPVQFTTGSGPFGSTYADLNGDGKPEIITINYTAASVSVFRNTATKGVINTASFATKQDFTAILQGTSIEAADLDGDGNVDLLVAGEYGFSILRNTTPAGSQTFSFVKTDYAPAPSGQYFAADAADLDGDGKKDIIVVSSTSTSVYVLKNNSSPGSISLASPTIIPINSYSDYSVTADVNGDAKPDIVLAGMNGSYGVIPNNSSPGNFSFGSPVTLPGSSADQSTVVAGDIDGDGKTDIIGTDGYSIVYLLHNDMIGVPAISSFSPTSGKTGDLITITGQGFNGITAVNFGGTPAASFTVVSPTSITAVIAKGASGAIGVTNNDGTGSKNGFTYIAPPPPQITSFSPLSAQSGESITITGSNFTNITSVKFGGTNAKSFVVNSTTSITAVINNGTSGDITVSGDYGTATFTGFVYIAKPQVDSFTPFSASKGQTVQISGFNFIGITKVTFGGVDAASFSIVSPTLINAVIGDGDSGVVEVTNSFGTASSPSYSLFAYITQPTLITSFTPSAAAAGATVTINGSNFSVVAAHNIVYFGTAKATVLSATSTQLTVTVPTGATYQPISVFCNSYTAYSNKYFTLTYPGGGTLAATTFGNPYTFDINSQVEDMTTADFDSDGKMDLAIANSGAYYVKIGENTSTGGKINFSYYQVITSTQQTDAPVGLVPVNNGKMDMYGYLRDDGFDMLTSLFTIFPGTQAPGYYFGRYGDRNTYSQLQGNIAVADIDGDGHPDLLVPDYTRPNLTLADLDGDGKPDLIVRNITGSLDIYRNTSTPHNQAFASPVNIPVVSNPTSIAIGDFDGDGKFDLAISCRGADLTNGSLVILKNASTPGNFSFTNVKTFNNVKVAGAICAGDLDGDGNADIALSSYGTTLLYKNQSTPGNFAFADAVSIPLPSSLRVIIADFDGDGRPDIAGLTNPTLTIFKNTFNEVSVTSFSPKTAAQGDAVQISGANLTGVTSVKFGGVAAKSFVVNSANLITAIVDNGASGTVDVANTLKTASIQGFTFIGVPVISAAGPTNFAPGDSVFLSTPFVSGLSYQWFKDGVKINGANSFYYAASVTGSYTLTITFGSHQLTSSPIQVNAVFTLPVTNFKVSGTNITCRGNNNGMINISAVSALNYTVTVNGGGLNNQYTFTTSKQLSNLKPDTYSICITVAGQPSYQQCFTVVLTEPKDLSVYSVIDKPGQTVTLQLNGGELYHITLNGSTYTTTQNQITLPLTKGTNNLLVTTDKDCQGIYKQFLTIDGVTVYPVPFVDWLHIDLGSTPSEVVQVEITNTYGKKIYTATLVNQSGKAAINLSALPSGVYFLKLSTTKGIFKIWKQ